VDSAEGMATLEAMSSHYNFRPGQRNKLVSEPPIAAPDEHAQLVEADQVPDCARSDHCCGRRAHRGGRGDGANLRGASETC
jgi:hypothetical protein